MAKKRLIETAIWSDPWFDSLSRDGKNLFLYFLLHPNLRESGFIQILDKQLKLDLEIEDLESTKKELYPKVLFDPEHNLFLLRNYFRKNLRGKNHVRDVEKNKSPRLNCNAVDPV